MIFEVSNHLLMAGQRPGLGSGMQGMHGGVMSSSMHGGIMRSSDGGILSSSMHAMPATIRSGSGMSSMAQGAMGGTFSRGASGLGGSFSRAEFGPREEWS